MKYLYRIFKKSNTWMAAVLIVAFSFPFVGNHADAASSGQSSNQGFVIHADSISGSMMPPSIIVKNGQPLVQFKYSSATIHGLILTNVSQTSIGPATLKVQAPLAKAKQMVVDASSYSFGGACVKLGKGSPQLVLKDVTLVAQKQTAADMEFQHLKVNTIPGDHGLKRPPVPGLLGGLANTGSSSLQDAISQLMKGHAPLLQCQGSNNSGNGNQNSGSPVNQVKKTTDQVTKTVGKATNVLTGTVDQTKKTARDMVNKVTGDAGKTVKQVLGGAGKTVNKLGGDVGKTVGDVTSGSPGKLPRDVQKTVCDGIAQIEKQLNGIGNEGSQIQQQAEKIVSDSRAKHKKLNDLIQNLSGLQNQINGLLGESAGSTQLNELKDKLGLLKEKESSIKSVKNQIKKADGSGQLSSLQDQLHQLQKQLDNLKNKTVCKSGEFSQVSQVLQKAGNEIKQGKSQSTQLPGQVSKANSIVKHTVKNVTDYVQAHDQSGGLFGGISSILHDLFGNITKLLGQINHLLS